MSLTWSKSEGWSLDQLGPQQLKYMTVLRDSSACLRLSLLGVLKGGDDEVEKKQAFFESLRDFMVESHFEPCSFMPWNTLIPPWYITLLIYLKLIPQSQQFQISKRSSASRDIYKIPDVGLQKHGATGGEGRNNRLCFCGYKERNCG